MNRLLKEVAMDEKHLFNQELMNASFLEDLYQAYQNQSPTLDHSWSLFFKDLDSQKLQPIQQVADNSRIENLINSYRRYGHLAAQVNPLSSQTKKNHSLFDLEKFGFSPQEKQILFPTLGLLPEKQASLEKIVERLEQRYASTLGIEFKDLGQPELEAFIQNSIEEGKFNQPFTADEKRLILDGLLRAELLESFLHTKYVGQKRFSLEGSETLIPMLNLMIEQGASDGVQEIVLGMSHRGRLNVLANILNKSFQAVFKEFDEHAIPEAAEGLGDVKYHKGYTSEGIQTQRGKIIKITLTPNPSHLESVDGVVEGQAHAKQILNGKENARQTIIPVLIHGDASLAGQGVVYEVLQMSRLAGFETGGTLHLVVNNQVGFTTAPSDARSTLYCTSIAKAFGAPVFHVNGEDPETCVRAILYALELRQRFRCEVFIDLNCYRKYGHNESDEPAFTQPIDYQLIRKKTSVRHLYQQQLIQEHVINQQDVEMQEKKFKEILQTSYTKVQEAVPQAIKPEKKSELFQSVETGVNAATLLLIAQRLSEVPSTMRLHPKIKQLIQERLRLVQENQPLEWGIVENLAYGSLVWEGVAVRLSGQDSERGTFSHRHALWVDQENGANYYPLAHLKENQGRFDVINSLLSEMGVLAFEYGYSLESPSALTIWEAQFGDFANGAQVIIDQYIASGEQKWGQISGLVLFLPHGYEGQGPEHSSGRLERFLALAGHENLQIVNPTTPAQLFHLLRRQVKQALRKPLIVFTPKGLLRYPPCTSYLEELTKSSFQDVLDDPTHPLQAKWIVVCNGRIYYDLIQRREKENKLDYAIIRLEQLYPLNKQALQKVLDQYPHSQQYFWVQEEPENMGAWTFVNACLADRMPLTYVGRKRSATPATGSHLRHEEEHEAILNQVFSHDS
jgi:2-oxoglutarate dehydrogenase E1 component